MSELGEQKLELKGVREKLLFAKSSTITLFYYHQLHQQILVQKQRGHFETSIEDDDKNVQYFFL